jgi:tetratricopeptide (TPR) repeat protein
VSAALPRTAAARVLWGGLIALALARLALHFVPSMHGWGLNVQRFLPGVFVWPAFGLLVLALIPGFAQRAAGAVSAAGAAFARHGALSITLAAVLGAGLVYAMPDRVRFVGDFLLRQGTVEEQASVGTLFPQALPLDVLLHYDLPLALARGGFADPNTAARRAGALEAGLLAALAVAFARALPVSALAAAAAAAIVFFGGYLAIFTGYSKAFVELVVLFAAIGVFGLAAVRAGERHGAGALLGAGVCVALALALHRSAPALLPALALMWAFRLRADGPALLRDPRALAALVIPLATLAAIGPRIVSTIVGIDAVHFQPAEVRAAGGPLRAALAGTRGADLVNLVLLLSPLALIAPFAAAAAWTRVRGRELAFLLALGLPCALVWPFIHPVGGLHRDWDDFAFGAAALSLLAAWVVARVIDGEDSPEGARHPGPGAHAWLGVAVIASVGVPALQWTFHHTRLESGLARVRAFVEEPPARTGAERARTFDYLGTILFQQERWRESATAFARAVETAPSSRMLHQWALAETSAENFQAAAQIYRRLLEKDSTNVSAWLGLGAVSSRFGDIHESRRGALEVLERDPSNETALAMLRYLDALPQAMRDSLTRLYPPR